MLFHIFRLQVYKKEKIEMFQLLMSVVFQYEKNVEESYGVKYSYC
ncbi:hypothetical protein DF16_pBMB400orf00112 (plasmid) [Bacillus thuringiensis serovar kurstaki str. YBT-1520]|nr:hypothetical protein DF16_pBMB400orf00112 [Bacillus thuringiensis serovar kurstaki str. YBT-1520]KEH49910.1 hypothetical protein BG09_1360 [Bacillus thuringiensis serovar kurstaki str. HD-1]